MNKITTSLNQENDNLDLKVNDMVITKDNTMQKKKLVVISLQKQEFDESI